MENLKGFFQEIEESVNELWREQPPRIQIKGWWWKKHIPHYQRMQKLLQELIDSQWRQEYPNIRKRIEDMAQEEMLGELRGINIKGF